MIRNTIRSSLHFIRLLFFHQTITPFPQFQRFRQFIASKKGSTETESTEGTELIFDPQVFKKEKGRVLVKKFEKVPSTLRLRKILKNRRKELAVY